MLIMQAKPCNNLGGDKHNLHPHKQPPLPYQLDQLRVVGVDDHLDSVLNFQIWEGLYWTPSPFWEGRSEFSHDTA